MVDSNLIILGALAAGGYYFVYVYEWPTVKEVAEDAANMAIDTFVAVAGVVVERGVEFAEDVAEEVLFNEDSVGYKFTQNIQDTSWKSRDELEDNEPGISWFGNSTGTQLQKDTNQDPCYRSRTDVGVVDGAYAIYDYFDDYKSVPGCDIECYRKTGDGTITGDGTCNTPGHAFIDSTVDIMLNAQQYTYDIHHPEEAAARKKQEAERVQEAMDFINNDPMTQQVMSFGWGHN